MAQSAESEPPDVAFSLEGTSGAGLGSSGVDDSGNAVVQRTDHQPFNFENDNEVNDGVTLGAPWVSIRFPARANRTYQVWMAAIVMADESGSYLFG